jgi:hypothetical protein
LQATLGAFGVALTTGRQCDSVSEVLPRKRFEYLQLKIKQKVRGAEIRRMKELPGLHIQLY